MRNFLLFPSLVFFSMAAFGAGTEETSALKDLPSLLKAAETMLIDGERSEATKILVSRINLEPSEKNKKILMSKLQQITTYFISEEAQKKYHYGLSFREKDPSLALESFNEAEKIEPGNTTLLLHKSELELIMGLCDESLKTSNKSLRFNPFHVASLIRKAQSLVCTKNLKAFHGWVKENSNISDIKIYILSLQAQAHFFSGEYGRSLAALSELERVDPKFSELWYWRIQIFKKTKSDYTAALEQYVKLCNETKSTQKKLYKYEPRVCIELPSATKELNALKETAT